MFFIVKSKKTDKCKVLPYLEDNTLSVQWVVSEFTGKIAYRIQYKRGFWFMGYLETDSKYIGESDMLKVLEFEDRESCKFFLKIIIKNFRRLGFYIDE